MGGEPRSTDLPLNVLLESLPDCTNQQNPNFLTLKKVGLKDKRILSKEKMKSKGKNRSILPPKVELFEDLPGDISPLKGEPRSTDLPLDVLLESLPDCTNQQNPNFLTLKKMGLKDKRILSKEKMKSKGKNQSILPPKVELFED